MFILEQSNIHESMHKIIKMNFDNVMTQGKYMTCGASI